MGDTTRQEKQPVQPTLKRAHDDADERSGKKKQIPYYVTVDEYCVRLNEQIEEYQQGLDVDNADFPWKKEYVSDHMPIMAPFYVNDQQISTVVTWNVLNKKYIRHLQKNENNDNQRLGNHPMADTDPAKQTMRELSIFNLIQQSYKEMPDMVMCLQEVSYELCLHLKTDMQPTHWVLVTRTDKPTAETLFRNCNVVIVPKAHYAFLSRRVVIDAEYVEGALDKSTCDYFTVEHLKHHVRFNILSVHLSWSDPTRFEKKFLGIKTPFPTIIAGDFNKGVRYPVAPMPGHPTGYQHMRVYRSERYQFPNPQLALANQPAFSHVTQFQNAANDTRRMLERFDHIIVLEPSTQRD